MTILSIITINLNNAAGLKQTVESVVSQTFQQFEFIVVDGGSTDGSVEVIRAYEQKITHWVSERDSGIYAAMNKGLAMASGEFVQFLNSGDWLYRPDVLANIFAGERHVADLMYGDYMRPDQVNRLCLVQQPQQLSVGLFFHRGLCHQSIFFKRKLFEQFGGYDESFKIAGDWEFIVRALLAGCSTSHLPFPVVQFAGDGISITQAECSHRERTAMLRRHLPETVFRDYLHLQSLRQECDRLKHLENWLGQARDRNVLLNYAMVSYWFWLKIKRALFADRKG